MNRRTLTTIAVVLILAFVGSAIAAEHMSAEGVIRGQLPAGVQKAVWKTVTDSWAAIKAKDAGWSDKWVHPDAVVWGTSYPMPRDRASVKKWDRFNFENSTTLTDDFSLAGMVLLKDTAVVHYYYTEGAEDREGKRKTTHGKCTDILMREGGAWKFIAWHCGDMPSGD